MNLAYIIKYTQTHMHLRESLTISQDFWERKTRLLERNQVSTSINQNRLTIWGDDNHATLVWIFHFILLRTSTPVHMSSVNISWSPTQFATLKSSMRTICICGCGFTHKDSGVTYCLISITFNYPWWTFNRIGFFLKEVTSLVFLLSLSLITLHRGLPNPFV